LRRSEAELLMVEPFDPQLVTAAVLGALVAVTQYDGA
jgi:hypothetical protein